MCKTSANAGKCTELADNPAEWNRDCPLSKPESTDNAMETFISSYKVLLLGDVEESRRLLKLIPSLDLQIWFDVHAQNVSTARYKGLGSRPPAMASIEKDPKKTFSHLSRQLYSRDYFHCRYCQSKVAPRSFFIRFSQMIGEDSFHIGRRNMEMPGIYLMAVSTLDHVTPHHLGGRTDEANLVTSCWPCNYGKLEFTVDQLGMDDPRLTPPIIDDHWLSFVMENS